MAKKLHAPKFIEDEIKHTSVLAPAILHAGIFAVLLAKWLGRLHSRKWANATNRATPTSGHWCPWALVSFSRMQHSHWGAP